MRLHTFSANFIAPCNYKRTVGKLSLTQCLSMAVVLALVLTIVLFALPRSQDDMPISEYEIATTNNVELSSTDNSRVESLDNYNAADGNEPEVLSTDETSLTGTLKTSDVDREIPQQEFPLIEIEAGSEATQLAQAKAAAELAERFNQQKLDRLEATISQDSLEMESLAKVEISYVVNQWKDAWANGDVERYLDFYSTNFVPANKQTLSQWQESRRQRLASPKNKTIEVSNFKVLFDDSFEQSTVEFDQRYESETLNDQSRKRLVFAKERQGWKVISETTQK